MVREYNKGMATTDQDKHIPNPSGKGGFGDNPQNRNPGGWKKDETARYKLEQILKFTDEEHTAFQSQPDTPTFEKRLSIAVQEGRWKELDGMINQVYGKPKESVELSNPDGTMTPTVRIIDERISPKE